ncbi:hypothetical protein OROHE_010986 [Orobanche hederae]
MPDCVKKMIDHFMRLPGSRSYDPRVAIKVRVKFELFDECTSPPDDDDELMMMIVFQHILLRRR